MYTEYIIYIYIYIIDIAYLLVTSPIFVVTSHIFPPFFFPCFLITPSRWLLPAHALGFCGKDLERRVKDDERY
jgi:hypothetical protein